MTLNTKTLESIRQGDINAFNSLFKDVYPMLYIHCRKFIADTDEAKDILQNVFMRLWEKRDDIDIHTSINAYLHRSVQNECLNHLRSKGKSFLSMDEAADNTGLEIPSDVDPDSDISIYEIEHITSKTIEELPPQCRSIFKLSRINGLKNQEIADIMEISVRTVETQIYRALKILKSNLKDYLA